MTIILEMDIKKNAELTSLAVEFRILSENLVDLLDGKAPVINRLKVKYWLLLFSCIGFGS